MKISKKYIDFFYRVAPDKQLWSMRNLHITIAVLRGKIIAYAFNDNKTHPKNLEHKKFGREGRDISSLKSSCSELKCILKIRKTNIPFKKITMVNMRLDRNGVLSNSCPCQSCRGLLKWLNFKNVYYTNEHGKFVCA